MINYGKRQFIRYVMMGLAFALVSFILGACETKAMTYAKSEKVLYYSDSALTTEHRNYVNVAISDQIQSLQNELSRNTYFYFDDLDVTDYEGGYIEFNFNILIANKQVSTSQLDSRTHYYCRRWSAGNNQYNCTELSSYVENTTDYEVEWVTPSINVQIMARTTNGEDISCKIQESNVTCPIPKDAKYRLIKIQSNVNYGQNAGDFGYYIWLSRSINIYADNTKEIIKEVEENHQETMDTITDDSDQDVSSMSNATGWLPQGTIDGLINLPIALVQGINTGLQGSCTPLTLPLPFVNEDMTLPCVKTIFDQITGLSTLLNLICTPIMAIILYNYLKNLFQWIQSQIAMEGNSNWGGV